ncbi:hypothetical protein AB0C90_40500 [Streptomyces sp. NPDC048550]|uniref:hypothetical protein n=1 Tax=Streptomyces sp. NPDC048550 TaxID=3155739 RepID=UPI003449A4BE
MARRQKRQRPPFGLPRGIVLLATPDGWRYSIQTVEGGMLCGSLTDELLDPEVALVAAATTVEELARQFHSTTVEVTWDPRQEPWAWTGRVVPVPGDVTAAS